MIFITTPATTHADWIVLPRGRVDIDIDTDGTAGVGVGADAAVYSRERRLDYA